MRDMKTCDVIVNNCGVSDIQLNLLQQLYHMYMPFPKTIINVGSWITRVAEDNIQQIDRDHYNNKVALEKLSAHITSSNSTLKSIYLTWGFHPGNPILERYPDLLDNTATTQAVDQLVCWNR